jgi:hypothetical protein
MTRKASWIYSDKHILLSLYFVVQIRPDLLQHGHSISVHICQLLLGVSAQTGSTTKALTVSYDQQYDQKLLSSKHKLLC